MTQSIRTKIPPARAAFDCSSLGRLTPTFDALPGKDLPSS